VDKTVELWRWRFTDDFGRRRLYPCRLSEADASTLRDAEKVAGSLEVRAPFGHTSDFRAARG